MQEPQGQELIGRKGTDSDRYLTECNRQLWKQSGAGILCVTGPSVYLHAN
jgi:hypothetical protein